MGKRRQDSAGETARDPVYMGEGGERWGAASRGKELRIWTRCFFPGEQIPAGIRGIVKHSRPARDFGMKCHSAKRSLNPDEVPPLGKPGQGAMLMLLQPPEVFSHLFSAGEVGGRNRGRRVLHVSQTQALQSLGKVPTKHHCSMSTSSRRP